MWMDWARRIRAIAQIGCAYTKDPYDRERFEELHTIALQMLSAASGQPVEVIADEVAGEKGYPTPKVGIRAVVFNVAGEILLVRQKATGLWAPPGGWADVEESPREVAAREVLEETGLGVRPVKLLAVFHRRKHPQPQRWWDLYDLFIQCEVEGGELRPDGLETDMAGFFGRENPPPLSLSRVTAYQLERMFAHRDNPDLPADFD